MERGDFDFTCVNCLKDPREQAKTDSVTQLSIFKAQGADFAKHLASVSVAMGVPAGGERIHGLLVVSYSAVEFSVFSASDVSRWQ
ncbi:MAG: hypothetical protein ACXWC8_17400 [Limisphaerales bacterium]